MEKEFLVNQDQLTKEGYVIISSYFLDYCVEILGTGPGMLYIQLLNYCHKGKDLAWPTLATLGKKMQFTPKSITKFHQVLLKHGLIKKISKGKTASGNYRRNIYQVTPLHMVKNTLLKGNIFPHIEEKITPNSGKKLPTNNTNLNITNATTTEEGKDAVVAVDFKKIKEKGDLSASTCAYPHADRCNAQAEERIHAPYNSKEHYKEQAVREQLVGLDIEESFIEKILKDFSPKKIEEKLDLLMERKNIQRPAGWLMAALKNDYQGEEQESQPHPHLNPPPSRGKTVSSIEYRVYSEEKTKKEMDSRFRLPVRARQTGGNDIRGCSDESERGNLVSPPEWTSTEKALEAIKLIQDNLSACISPINERRFKCPN